MVPPDTPGRRVDPQLGISRWELRDEFDMDRADARAREHRECDGNG